MDGFLRWRNLVPIAGIDSVSGDMPRIARHDDSGQFLGLRGDKNIPIDVTIGCGGIAVSLGVRPESSRIAEYVFGDWVNTEQLA